VSIGISARSRSCRRFQKGAYESGDAGDEQRGGQDRQQQVVEVPPRRPFEQVEHEHAAHRGRHRPQRHPGRQPQVDGVLAPVLVAADGLRDRGVGEIGAHRGDRLHPEDEDQERRHQRAPADARHPDEDPHAQAEPDQGYVHGSGG
jgi:hypothetical protein